MVVVFTCRVVGMISFALDASKVVRFVQLARKKLMDGNQLNGNQGLVHCSIPLVVPKMQGLSILRLGNQAKWEPKVPL